MSGPGEMSRGEGWLGKRVRAFYASDRDRTHGDGRVIAYADAPTVEIERDDGSRFNWKADLCEGVPGKRVEGGPPPESDEPFVAWQGVEETVEQPPEKTRGLITTGQLASHAITDVALTKKIYSVEDLFQVLDAAVLLEMEKITVQRVGPPPRKRRGRLDQTPLYRVEMTPWKEED